MTFRLIRMCYREKISSLIHQYPRMVLNDRGDALHVDWGFISRISSNTPEKYLPDLRLRIEEINMRFERMLPRPSELSRYCGSQSQVAERLINGFLVRYDNDRKISGLATFSDMLKHELGVAPCYLSFESMT